MNTEKDARQIIDVILAAGELKRFGPSLISEITNAIALGSYSAGGFGESIEYKRDKYEDPYEAGLDDIIRRQEEGFIESEDEEYEEPVEYEEEEEEEEEALYVSAFSTETSKAANLAFRKNQQSNEDLLELNNVAQSLAQEAQSLFLNNTYLRLVAEGDSDLEDSVNKLLTHCNRFTESFASLDEVNKGPLSTLISNGINDLNNKLKSSSDFSDRLQIIRDSYIESLMRAEEVSAPPGDQKDISEEIPGIRVDTREEKERIGPSIDEFLLQPETEHLANDNEWTRKTLDAYDFFERNNQAEFIDKFKSNKESLSFDSGVLEVTEYDKLLDFIYNPRFPSLIYENITGLDDGKSFYEKYEEIDLDNKSFLSFYGSVFYGQFKSISEAIGANIIIPTDPDQKDRVTVELDNKTLEEIKRIIKSEVLFIIGMIDEVYSFAVKNLGSGISLQDLGAKVNLYRRFIAKKLDYLFGSIKRRDIEVITYVNDQDYLKDSHKDFIKNNCLISNIQSQDGLFFRDEQLYNSFVFSLSRLLKPSCSNNFFHNRKDRMFLSEYKISWTETLYEPFLALLANHISAIIRKHLGSNALYDESNISEDILELSDRVLVSELIQQRFSKTTITNIRTKCSVCGKMVYRDYKPTRRPKFQSAEERAPYDAMIYNPEKEIKYDIYSLVRADGTVISLNDLIGAEFEIGDEEYSKLEEISKAYNRSGQIDRIKSWETIEEDYYSGDSFKNIEAIIRKSHALKTLGGRLLSSNVPIYTSRIRCPFGKKVDVMKGKFDLDKKSQYAALSGVWDCGFREELPQAQGLSLYLENMVIDEDTKNRLLNLSKAQAAGGFKFSSRSFICPEKIGVPSDPDKAKDVIKDSPLLVMPSSWPKNTFTDKDSAPSANHPITQLTTEGESIISLRCGANTSISQFDRVDFANKIKKLFDDENEDLYNNLISSMIELGVDISDILPFIALKHSYSEVRDPDFSIDSSVIDNLMIRSSRISSLLKSAMATKTTKQREGQIDVKRFFDDIKDIKLICRNNHSFSINESLSFANNYIDIPLNKDKNRKMLSTMIGKGAFNIFGQKQFDLLLSIKNGPLKRISRKKASERGMKPYSDFLLREDKVSNIYFVNPDDPDGDFVYYINSGDYLSIYPMSSEFMTASEDFVAKSGIVKSEYMPMSVAGISASSTMGDSEENPEARALRNLAGGVGGAGPDDQGYDPQELLDRQIDREKELAKAQERAADEIQRLSFIAIALIQNAIISIQELLLAATATNREDVVFYGTKILKKKLEEKINSEFFSNKLSDLLGTFFNSDEYEYLTEYNEEIVSISVENIKRSIIEDFGKDPRAFIYAIGSMFNRYLHRKIIEELLLIAKNSGDDYFIDDLTDVLIRDKALSVSQVSSAIPSFVEPREIAEFERSLKLKPLPFTQDIQEKVEKLNTINKFKNITEMWMGKQIVLAATAIYLSDRLADLCNKYLLKSSYKYIGYPLMPGFNLCASQEVMSISIDDILMARAGALFPNPKDIEGIEKMVIEVSEMISELTKLQDGAAYASRSGKYQERALDYIGYVYKSLFVRSNLSNEDLVHANNLLSRVISNTRNVEVLLAPPDSGKYAEYFSRFENAHMLMPSMYHPVLLIPSKIVDKYVAESGQVIQRELQAEKQFSKPIYLIKDDKNNYSYIFNISSDIAFRRSFVLLAFQSDIDLLKSLLPVEEAEDFESKDFESSNRQYFNNGWRLLYGNVSNRDVKKAGLLIEKASDKKETQISICDHPGTFIFRDDDGNPVSYKNPDLDIDSGSGIAIGSYGRGAKECQMNGKFYPPLRGSISSVGIPIPIQMQGEDYGLYITLSDMPIDIPVDSGGMIRINLSDLLQRDPPEEANRILLEIEKEYAAFLIEYNRLKNINPESAESKKQQFSSYARSKFNRYRDLPLKVVKNGFGRTNLDDAGRYNTTPGWYIPIVNPVIANTILTKACFGSEYVKAGIFSEAVYNNEEILSLGINAVQNFLVNINGYDKLAALFNSREGMVNGESITPLDLLDPYELLVSERSIDGRETTRLSRKMLLRDTEDTEDTEDTGSISFKYDEESRSVEGLVVEIPSVKYRGIYRDELEAWEPYIPSFYWLNVGVSDDAGEANVGVPKLVVDTPIFRREKMRDMSGVRSQDVGSDLLSTSDLTPLLMRESQDAGGVYNFAEVLQKFFGKKFKGIREFIEEYDSTPFDNKTAYFDSALLFNKVSSNILCSDFIKKSEKYQTKIFGRIIINDEAIGRLFD